MDADGFGAERSSEGRSRAATSWVAAGLWCAVSFPGVFAARRLPEPEWFWGAVALAVLGALMLAGAFKATLQERRRGEAWMATRPHAPRAGGTFEARFRLENVRVEGDATARLSCNRHVHSAQASSTWHVWDVSVSAVARDGALVAAFDTSGFVAPVLGPRETLRWTVMLSGVPGGERAFTLELPPADPR